MPWTRQPPASPALRSTETQAASATQVKAAIRSVSQTTESNAAAAEEMAASAEELGGSG